MRVRQVTPDGRHLEVHTKTPVFQQVHCKRCGKKMAHSQKWQDLDAGGGGSYLFSSVITLAFLERYGIFLLRRPACFCTSGKMLWTH